MTGSVLIARRIGPASQTWTRLLFAVEDEAGKTSIVTFNQHPRDVLADEFIPEGAVVAIKEPYLHMDYINLKVDPATRDHAALSHSMFWVIRIDHPSDLVVLPAFHDSIPLRFHVAATPGTAMLWKEKGNVAFGKKRFLEAQRWYVHPVYHAYFV